MTVLERDILQERGVSVRSTRMIKEWYETYKDSIRLGATEKKTRDVLAT
jgi:hypothetical protein